MPPKDLTIAEKIVVLRKIKEQSNTSHRPLAKIIVPRHVTNPEAKKYIDELRIYFM